SSKRKPKAPYICSAGKNHYSPKTRSVQSVSSPLSLISTGPNGAEGNRRVKKHLFSDTDTDFVTSEEKKVVGKPAMSRSQRPRRAAATTTKTYKEPETDDSQSESEVVLLSTASHVTSSNGVSCNWDLDEGDMDTDKEMEVPKAVLNSSELRKKFENRHVMTEVHNKQSLTAVQQHLTSLNTQLNKYRTGRLEKVLEVLLGEIDKLEEDETLLKTMEKDMT
ncbi:unnamed protein product, partial [Tetraodon nigroviridis]